MVYVKRRGMILLVNDEQVSKYTAQGFAVLGDGPTSKAVPVDVSGLLKRAEALKLDLPDGLTADQVKAAVEKAEQEAEKKAGDQGGKGGK